MLKYGDLVGKHQNDSRMRIRRGRIFSLSSEERCTLRKLKKKIIVSLLEHPVMLIMLPICSFRLISKLLATGKTLQRK
jgi:hypothetical protein